MVNTYDKISELYEKWSSGDAVYKDSQIFYLNLLRQMNKGNYMEIGVGTGRISLNAVRETPISITGIDISKKMISICYNRYQDLEQRCGSMKFSNCNILDISFVKEYDGVIMPFRTVGHFLQDDELQKLFECVKCALKPGGWFVFDHYMFNRKWAEEHNNVPILMYQDNELVIKDLYNYYFEKGYMHCQVIVNDCVFESFDFRWISPSVIMQCAQKSGFEIYRVMGEFDGTSWNENSYEQIWCLKKPGNNDLSMPDFNCELI